MNRREFIERLQALLADLTEEERQEAIQYYEDYFEDAGMENEEKVIQEIGSPEKVALMIREGLRGEDGGEEYRETGYAQTRYEEKYVPQAREVYTERTEKHTEKPWTNRTLKIVLILAILCVIFPKIIHLIGSIAGAVIAVITGVFAFFIGLVCLAFGLGIAGICIIVAGILTIIPAPSAGLLVIGIGLILLAVSFVAAAVTIKICRSVLPLMFHIIVNCVRSVYGMVRG